MTCLPIKILNFSKSNVFQESPIGAAKQIPTININMFSELMK
jgi:hypothetical protein